MRRERRGRDGTGRRVSRRDWFGVSRRRLESPLERNEGQNKRYQGYSPEKMRGVRVYMIYV